MNDVFHGGVVNFEILLQKLKFVLLGGIEMEPKVRIAPPQQINCKVSLNFLKVSLGMPNG